MAQSRNGSDGPKISMRVERGRLVPVSQHDFELLDSWREGAIVNVSPVLAQSRPLERRYFAMLSKLLKVTDTPWTNTLDAHESIKLATGFVDPYRKKNGEWSAHARHISTFTDTELSEFFELFCGIVRERFHIDPETLRKEAADIGIQESSGSASPSDPSDDGPGAGTIPAGVGEPAKDGLTREDMDWLKMTARMLTCATVPGGGEIEVQLLDRQKRAIVKELTPGTISAEARALAMKIFRYCENAVMFDGPFDKPVIANLAGCKVEDLRPEAR